MKGKSTEEHKEHKSGENDKSNVIIGEIQSKIVTRNKVKTTLKAKQKLPVLLAITCSR